MWIVALVVLAVGVAATAQDAPEQPAFPAAQAGRTIRVAVIGDGAAGRVPAALAKLLGKGYEVRGFCTNNHSVLRTQGRSVWRRYESVHAVHYKPDVVILMFEHAASRPNTWNADKGRFVGDYKAFIARVRAGGAGTSGIYLCLPPALQKDCAHGVDPERLASGVVPAVRRVAGDLTLPLIDTFTPLKGRADLVGNGGVFPNATGAAVLAGTIYKALTGKEPPPVVVPKKPTPKVEAPPAVAPILKPSVNDVIELKAANVADATGDGPDGKGNTPDDTWGFWFELAHAQGNFMRLNIATAAMTPEVRAKGIPRKVWGPIGASLPNPKDTDGWILSTDWDGRYEGIWGDRKDSCIIIHPYNEKVYAGKMAITCRLPAGVYAVTAKVTDLNTAGGDGISWRVEVANGNLRHTLIAKSDPFGDKVGPASVTVDVQGVSIEAGQLIRFVIDPNKHWGGDMTRIEGLKITRTK